MTEREKFAAGLVYDTGFPGREEYHLHCADLCYRYNHTRPSVIRKLSEADSFRYRTPEYRNKE